MSLLAFTGIGLLTFGIFQVREGDHGMDSSDANSVTENARPIERNPESKETSSFKLNSPGQDLSVQPNEDSVSNTAEPESLGVENHVETFLTSTELHTFHTQLLERFSNQTQSAAESIPISSLELERSQQYQLYLEPEDQIILINNTPVIDLASNPAVGSMLAGPNMKLTVQRGDSVFEIDLSAY